MNFLGQYWGWIAAGFIVVVGLGAFGLADLFRFSIKRCWAISGVCFDESIRKKVLWITPLAIVGVVIVSQLQRALDEQDAIRQTIKVCLFASGLVVVLSSLILACTNLPKEIESRVIFTIVTKPTTRLELIIGKVIGFARVSGVILIIMGLFTWGYLLIREQGKLKQIDTRVKEGAVSGTEKARLDHYSQTGLLSARKLWMADELQVLGQRPDLKTDQRIIHGDGDQDVLVAFPITKEMFPNGPDTGIGDLGLIIRIHMDWERTGPIADSLDPDQNTPAPVQLGPYLTTQPAPPPRPPGVGVNIADSGYFDIITAQYIFAATTREKMVQGIREWAGTKDHKGVMSIWSAGKVRLPPEGEAGYAYIWVPPTMTAEKLYGQQLFYIRVNGANQNVDYKVGPDPIQVFVPQAVNNQLALDQGPAIQIPRLKDDKGVEVPVVFHGRLGIHGEQEMSGGADPNLAAAVYSFRGAPKADLVDGKIPFEISNLQIQRSNESDNDEAREDPTNLAVTVRDKATGRETSLDVSTETRQTAFFTVPADAITSPDYDIILQCSNKGNTVGFYPNSLELVIGRESFALNLVKSLSILWMMSILVIILSIMCSTFLSWPIAIVLTVILLLSHWGVDQVSDVNGPGLGRLTVQDLKIGDKDAPIAHVVSSAVDTLSSALNVVAKVLPDTEQFDAVSNIEQGSVISGRQMGAGLMVLLGFGLPGIVLAFVALKYKEVAP